MKIAITSFGSEGDIRPYIALAKGLRAAGHDAWIVAMCRFEERAKAAQVPWRDNGMPDDLNRYLQVMEATVREKNLLKQTKIIFNMVKEDLCTSVPKVAEAVRDADVVVHHHIDIAGFAAAELQKKPRFPGVLFHTTLPTRASIWNGKNLGGLLNRALSGLARTSFSWMTDASLNAVRATAGLPPEKDVILRATESPYGTLIAISKEMVPTDPLWEGRYVQTGYWFLDEPSFEPAPKLREFFEAGEPPVVVTFGSMAGADAKAQTRAIVEGLSRLGRRAILQAGWMQLGEGELPANVLRVDYVPHDWLFARAACVLHHGGAGTTAAVLRAGAPQAIVWHLGDQPIWGALVARRGIGPKPIQHHKLSGAWIARALEEALSPAVVARAKELGARVRAEDGVGNAVRAIEASLRKKA